MRKPRRQTNRNGKTLFSRLRYPAVLALVTVYLAAALCFSVAIFTPYWVIQSSHNCNRTGLFIGECDFLHTEDASIRAAFYWILPAICILYTNIALTTAIFVFESPIIMALVSISHGVLYPIGALAILAASISLSTYNTVGFSAVLGIISGGFMLAFYIGLRVYDYQYIESRKVHLTEGVDFDDGHISDMMKPRFVNHNKHHYKF